ncbi:four helix bundle protein [Ferruginibacter paludis]|uniref:four helix bundle protein n=1 Tax=Ferruginibacter paludis TaxID=1310417 RepID=UPI0025B47FBA|nr:four helix bundle protein [Ferruginibacter paludis]MDN3658777.1 four helix bundle protein [Ferruginibacter paludis]
MAFKFESLKIWNKALDLSIEIDEMAKGFPKYEVFNLCNQIRKAADSIVLNIAEGSTGQTNPEFKRFLNYSLRSGIEVVSCLFIAKKKNYIQDEIFSKYYNEYETLVKMISSFRGKLI